MCENREALAWAAGFFDGEGSTCKMGRSVCLTIQQSNRPLLERFNAVTGASASIYGPYIYKDPRYKSRYDLRVYGIDKINAILDQLWPWLGQEKRDQAERVRKAWENRPLMARPDRDELGRFPGNQA